MAQSDANSSAQTKPPVRLRRPDRLLTMVAISCPDDLVGKNPEMRTIAAPVQTMDLSAFCEPTKAREGNAGRGSTGSALLVSPWLYADIGGIGSARELDRPCKESRPFQSLCGGVTVNYHLLSDSRVGHAGVLGGLFPAITGDLDGALARLTAADRLGRAAFGAGHAVVAASSNIGAVLRARGDLDGALAHFAEAERISRLTSGDASSPNVATCVNNVCHTLEGEGNLHGALACNAEAERIARAALGGNHPNVARDVSDTGLASAAKGDLDGATVGPAEAERIDRAAFGDNHPNSAIRVDYVGSVKGARGDLDGATARYEEAARTDLAASGGDHPSYARGTNHVGFAFTAEGDVVGRWRGSVGRLTFASADLVPALTKRRVVR